MTILILGLALWVLAHFFKRANTLKWLNITETKQLPVGFFQFWKRV